MYFAVVQADNGILEKLPKNVLVFGAGGVGNIPIPLASSTVVPGRAHRDIFASFVGVINNHANNRTGIRSLMRDRLQNEKDFFIREAKTDVNLFHDTMTRSVFALCPRGFGKTSFRLYEAMAMGAIPVYIYDDPWLPYTEFLDWESFSVLVPLESIGDIPAILRSHTAEDIRKKQQRICELQSEGHFSFEGICRYIFNTLAERSPGPLLTRN